MVDILLFFPCQSFSQPHAVIQVVVEGKGDHKGRSIVVVSPCKNNLQL